jgi:hypothetical protein
MARRTSPSQTPIVSTRIRSIAGQSFVFLPHRFLRDGFLASLSPEELRLYVLLLLAGDRFGVSFYHGDSICSILQLPRQTYLALRDGLVGKDLIAFDGARFQVLSLPERPVMPPPGASETSKERPEPRRRTRTAPSPEAIDMDELRILHDKTHPIPSEHPDCRSCQERQATRELLRSAIATLEAKAHLRPIIPITDGPEEKREEKGEQFPPRKKK